jgi:tetratricopeptide (TPR) repeat protein
MVRFQIFQPSKKITIFVVFLLGFIFLEKSLGNDNAAFFLEGNRLFQQEKYSAAVSSYEQILQGGVESSELYYNLGNAYFRSGNIGKAILNYERARRLAPLNDDVRYNLEIANLSIVDKIQAPPGFFLTEILDDLIEFLGLKLNLNAFTRLVLAIYVIFMLVIIVRILIRRIDLRQKLFYLVIPVFVVFFIFIVLLQIQIYKTTHTNEAIILVEEVDILGAPEENGKQLFALHQGTKVKINRSLSKNDKTWLQIQLLDGKTGWMDETALEKI